MQIAQCVIKCLDFHTTTFDLSLVSPTLSTSVVPYTSNSLSAIVRSNAKDSTSHTVCCQDSGLPLLLTFKLALSGLPRPFHCLVYCQKCGPSLSLYSVNQRLQQPLRPDFADCVANCLALLICSRVSRRVMQHVNKRLHILQSVAKFVSFRLG